MNEKLKPDDRVLIAADPDDGGKLKAVKGMDENGKLQAVNPKQARQSDFIRVDRHADMVENFFKNFFNQAKNPSHTGFFALTADVFNNLIKMNDEDLEKHRINPKDYLNNQVVHSIQKNEKETVTEKTRKDMETKNDKKNEFKQFDTSRIPENEYQKYGIKPGDLDGELKAMSYGYKSPHLVDINPKIEGVEYPMKARLSLEEQPDGSLKFIPHPYQQQIDMEKPFQGVILPNDIKENLLTTGNGGRIMELEPIPGEKIPSLISIDKLTNRLEAIPLDKLAISQNLKGVELSSEQQKALKEGEKILIEGMISRKTMGTDNPRKFDAYVQFNAAKGGYDFSYDGLDRNRYKQNNDQQQSKEQEQPNKVRIPQMLLGVELSKDQQSRLRENKLIYVQGMVKDGQNQPFNAYVKINNEKGKLDFFRWNPDKAKKQGAEIKPANESKTQVAVNSEGKTNEATKNVREPLKQGQQKPSESQDKRQKQENKKKKSRGVKM